MPSFPELSAPDVGTPLSAPLRSADARTYDYIIIGGPLLRSYATNHTDEVSQAVPPDASLPHDSARIPRCPSCSLSAVLLRTHGCRVFPSSPVIRIGTDPLLPNGGRFPCDTQMTATSR